MTPPPLNTAAPATPAPGAVLLNPRIVGQAENAHRPPLERILGRTGTTFPQWVALRLTAAAGGATDRAQLAERIVDGLKIAPELAGSAIDGLAAARLFESASDDPSSVRLTESGRARFTEIKTAVDEVVSTAYGTIPQQDLETAARVLTTITQRLDAIGA